MSGSEPRPRLLVATTNRKKLAELQAMLDGPEMDVLCLADIGDHPEVEEDGRTFQENAVKKAAAFARHSGLLTLAEDSGLCVDALGGAPGVLSARFSGEDKDDLRNCRKVLDLLKDVPWEKRAAHFVSACALASPGELVGVVEGRVDGVISFEMKGGNGFGYDPLFYYQPLGRNFAELAPEQKNLVSHRHRALEAARQLLIKYLTARSPGR